MDWSRLSAERPGDLFENGGAESHAYNNPRYRASMEERLQNVYSISLTFRRLSLDIQRTILNTERHNWVHTLWLFWMFPEKFMLKEQEDNPPSVWMNLRNVLRACDIREWAFFYQVNALDTRIKKTICAAVPQPRDDTTFAWFPSAIPRGLVMTIVRFVGAHRLEAFWPCIKCKPYWLHWLCNDCNLINVYVEWSRTSHFGRCGKKCLCCRSARLRPSLKAYGAKTGCLACEDLWQLKGTC